MPCVALHLACAWVLGSPKLLGGLHTEQLVTSLRTSHHISLPGHFSIPNNEVGERQKRSAKIFGSPHARETRAAQICLKPLLPGIEVFHVYVSSAHNLWSLLLVGLANHEWQEAWRSQTYFPQLLLSCSLRPNSHCPHFKGHLEEPVFVSPSFQASIQVFFFFPQLKEMLRSPSNVSPKGRKL